MSRILFEFFDGASQAGNASASIPTIVLSAATANAVGIGNGLAEPAIPQITLTAATASATGVANGLAQPAVPAITLVAPTATANGVIPVPDTGGLSIIGSPAGVSRLFPRQGVATPRPTRQIACTAPLATAFGVQWSPIEVVWGNHPAKTGASAPKPVRMFAPTARARGKQWGNLTPAQVQAIITTVMAEEMELV